MNGEIVEIYLVGGALRDELLGLPVFEQDWVVVGATPEELTAQGYKPVGKDFPVFLHPETKDEYALARTERKTGKGYKGFTFHTAPSVTLEEDLKRRDLTINAMARGKDGILIDPYHGQQDLKDQKLKHVSEAFGEDPVRILRVARIAAKLPHFTVHKKTNELMQKMVDNGEVRMLVAERVWQEFSRALEEKSPHRFFEVLDESGALSHLFPEIKLHGRGLAALDLSLNRITSGPIRFAVLCHDLPIDRIKHLCDRLKIPREYCSLAVLTANFSERYNALPDASPDEILYFIKQTDALRRRNRFNEFLLAAHASIEGSDDLAKEIDAMLEKCIRAIQSIDARLLHEQGFERKEFAEQLEILQISAIKEALSITRDDN